MSYQKTSLALLLTFETRTVLDLAQCLIAIFVPIEKLRNKNHWTAKAAETHEGQSAIKVTIVFVA